MRRRRHALLAAERHVKKGLFAIDLTRQHAAVETPIVRRRGGVPQAALALLALSFASTLTWAGASPSGASLRAEGRAPTVITSSADAVAVAVAAGGRDSTRLSPRNLGEAPPRRAQMSSPGAGSLDLISDSVPTGARNGARLSGVWNISATGAHSSSASVTDMGQAISADVADPASIATLDDDVLVVRPVAPQPLHGGSLFTVAALLVAVTSMALLMTRLMKTAAVAAAAAIEGEPLGDVHYGHILEQVV
eukprot:TRINITY_DN49579_c0_g1_i1.p1 TRINITY_DN49579_c0_g1~~TRINITY_DN49579_c0_g1_i1.p1  ORF type:complete len:250 (-),score=34.91 TRINITY_DN49579_c0_g1_i1:32-781(-)